MIAWGDEVSAWPPNAETSALPCVVMPVDLQINYMQEGIRLALEGQVEKHSDVLGRNAVSGRRRMQHLNASTCMRAHRCTYVVPSWLSTSAVEEEDAHLPPAPLHLCAVHPVCHLLHRQTKMVLLAASSPHSLHRLMLLPLTASSGRRLPTPRTTRVSRARSCATWCSPSTSTSTSSAPRPCRSALPDPSPTNQSAAS